MLRSQARRRRPPVAAFSNDLPVELHGASALKTAPRPTSPLVAVPNLRDHADEARRQHQRLAVAAHLSGQLAPLQNPMAIAERAVSELHTAFQFHLAVIQRLEGETLHVLAAAGPPVDEYGFLAFEQSIHQGVNGRVARTGRLAFVPDTRHDADYLRRDASTDPGSELSLPIIVDGRIWGVLNLEQVEAHAFDAERPPARRGRVLADRCRAAPRRARRGGRGHRREHARHPHRRARGEGCVHGAARS